MGPCGYGGKAGKRESGDSLRGVRRLLVPLLLVTLWGVTVMGLRCFAQSQTDEERGEHYTAKVHIRGGLTCNDCHGEGPKKPVEQERCRQCHGDYKDLAALTADYDPNPHNNHTANLNCTLCHHMHRLEEVYCQRCHAHLEFMRHRSVGR